MSSLRQKIILGYSAFAILLVGLSVFHFLESRLIEKQVQAGAIISEFFDVALEIRRFEKNYFLYHQAADLAENRAYTGRAMHLLDEGRENFEQLAPAAQLTRLRETLDRYAGAMTAYAGASNDPGARSIRELGLAIVTEAQAMANSERSVLQGKLAHQRHFLLATLAGLLVLLGVAAAVVSASIVQPLHEMERRMEMVAAGNKTRLSLTARDREILALTRAFNHVLDEVSLRQQQQLIQADRLASLGRLISGVAHEVNNPLSNISSSAQILLEDGESSGPEWRHEMLSQIDSETLRAQRIVRSLLDYAREREFRRQAVPLRTTIEETLLFLRNDLPANVALRVDVADDLTVSGDKPRLQQVVLNLVKNAVDALDQGGEILISAHAGVADPGAEASPETVEIVVRDTGQGIPPETLLHIFEPFFTTKADSHGSGLGLFIVREIIEEHGGVIYAESRPGEFTQFLIRLPRRNEAHPENP